MHCRRYQSPRLFRHRNVAPTALKVVFCGDANHYPGRYTGRTFPSYMRIGLCVRQGIPIVVEEGSEPLEDWSRVARALGGV